MLYAIIQPIERIILPEEKFGLKWVIEKIEVKEGTTSA